MKLRAGTSHRIQAVVSDAAGNETTSDAVEMETDPLPEDFPDLVVKVRAPERMEPGVTLFNLSKSDGGESVSDYGHLMAVDDKGAVVWYYRTDHAVGDARQLRNGNILYSSGRSGKAFEIDMLGNVVHRWHATGTPKEVPADSIPVDTDTFHHEIREMPSGNLLTLSSEVRVYEDYPTSSTDPDAPRGKANVVGDVIAEFTREGDVVYELKLLDVLDPYRPPSNPTIGGAGFWRSTYETMVEGELVDWAHFNSIFYDPRDDSILLSGRRQDAVVKIDRKTSELTWILGPHDRWKEPWSSYLLTPKGELEWQNHEHSASVTPAGTILMFDNGTFRDGPTENDPPESEKYSRAVEFAVDESTMEVRQVWAYGGPGDEIFYSRYISDADRLPETGNVLVTDGARETDAEGVAINDPSSHRWARIVELAHTTPAEKVFELVIEDEDPIGWHVYRATRVSSLYGPEVNP